ncbi:MAG: hypothetical protein AAB390_04030 [Patescibacteria group bacterium]
MGARSIDYDRSGGINSTLRLFIANFGDNPFTYRDALKLVPKLNKRTYIGVIGLAQRLLWMSTARTINNTEHHCTYRFQMQWIPPEWRGEANAPNADSRFTVAIRCLIRRFREAPRFELRDLANSAVFRGFDPFDHTAFLDEAVAQGFVVRLEPPRGQPPRFRINRENPAVDEIMAVKE